MADVVLVNKVDSASAEQLREVMADIDAVDPGATVIVRAASPVSLGGWAVAGR